MTRERMKLEADIFEFRKRWLNCKTLAEMEKVREEYFNLPYGYETLDEHWDKVVLGEFKQPILKPRLKQIKQMLGE